MHRVVIDWDEALQLAAVVSECECAICTDLQASIADFLESDEIIIEGVSQ